MLLVFDTADRKSFEDARDLLPEAKKYGKENVVIQLISVESDVNIEPQISSQEGTNVAKLRTIISKI